MAVISPLDFDEVDDELRNTLQPMVDRLGYFGDFFRYGAHAPAVLVDFMRMSGSLKVAIPPDLNEVAALTVCSKMGFAYERVQHEQLSLKLGFAADWVAKLVGRASNAELTPAQEATRQLARATIDNRPDVACKSLSSIVEECGQAVAVALLFQITRFQSICTIGNLLGMQPPVTSIFAAEMLEGEVRE